MDKASYAEENTEKTNLDKMIRTVSGTYNSLYEKLHAWYIKNNNVVTIIPDLLRAHILDFFSAVLSVLLIFWVFLRYLSR